MKGFYLRESKMVMIFGQVIILFVTVFKRGEKEYEI
ncbi:hypothetical protein X953_06510 [Virgibacillus sp. SK37]|nr:hypothetical protein X953_06510 [Virgibacillus sp. SK37]